MSDPRQLALFPEQPIANPRPPEAPCRKLPTYNGFDHLARVATIAIQRQAILTGKLVRPTACSICGWSKPDDPKGSGYIFLHLEDYRRPIDGILPCCKVCHAALHNRFSDPGRWKAIVRRHTRQEAWFVKLTMNGKNMDKSFGEIYPDNIKIE